MNKIKGCTMASGILKILGAIGVGVLAFMFLIVGVLGGAVGETQVGFQIVGVVGFVLFAICLAVAITMLVFAILEIKTSTKNHQDFKTGKGMLVSSTVLDLVFAVFLIIVFVTSPSNIAYILFAILMIVTAVLKIIDIVRIDKKLKITQDGNLLVVEKKETVMEDIKNKLQALDELKANGIIKDDEYLNLRKDMLDKVKK